MPSEALVAARQQLVYWEAEQSKAHELKDDARLKQCKAAIQQSEMIIAALEYAAANLPRQPK